MTFIDYLFIALGVLGVAVLGYGSYGLVRNQKVYRVRISLLNAISVASREDLQHQSAYKWRYEEFDRVTYNEMMRSFRDPISMYDNLDFIDPTVRRGNLFEDETVIRSESELEGDS